MQELSRIEKKKLIIQLKFAVQLYTFDNSSKKYHPN